MNSTELTTQLFLGLATISLGTFLGALGNKLVSSNFHSKWKYAFYFLSIISLIASILFAVIFAKKDFISWLTIVSLIISGVLLFAFTKKVLDKKHTFKTHGLDPIVNNFTTDSDKKEIKLFGGDLNFFGEEPIDMNDNKQYSHLKRSRFGRILVLCEEPRTNHTKIRYGKILNELSGIEMKFYNPEDADLLIRGRMKTLNGVEKLMIYSKIKSGIYETIETDTANSNGALYNNIWKLIWSLANGVDAEMKADYIKLYNDSLQ
jgi:hypothetical protein